MPELGWCVGAAVGVICAIRWAAAAVYDVLIVKMTTRWYASVLKELDRSSTLLDVGIGTATACVEIHAIEQTRLRRQHASMAWAEI